MLTDTTIRKTKAGEKPFKLTDGRGLCLLVNPNGAKLWRFNYRFGGKQKTLAFGAYPDVPLADARERREQARKLLAGGVDPGAAKKAAEAAKADTFEAVGREWFAKYRPSWADSHAGKVLARLENDVFPWIGGKPVAEVAAQGLLAVPRRIRGRWTPRTGRGRTAGRSSATPSPPGGPGATPPPT